MPAPTNTERIAELEKLVYGYVASMEAATSQGQKDLQELDERLRTVAAAHRHESEKTTNLEYRCSKLETDRIDPAQFAVLGQRLTHLEKLLDEGRTRRWQVWLAVLGAIFSAIIALIVAIIKK
jgi:hypothetical protein